MTQRTIRNIDVFKIPDDRRQREAYGFRQSWYPTIWQRKSGCGPTAFANILYYLRWKLTGQTDDNLLLDPMRRRLFMEDIWTHVRPSVRGINSAKMLYDGILAYAQDNNLRVDAQWMDIPHQRGDRPDFQKVLSFVERALISDVPVAFLNLDHGTQTQLDSWHWVTIVAMRYPKDRSRVLVDCIDAGPLVRVDLFEWYRTTTRGGGLVCVDLMEGDG